jgi:hypothetical protein
MQGVAVMANLLLDALRNTRTSPAEATDACKYLLQLQAEGSPCMERCDPIQLYLTTQVELPANKIQDLIHRHSAWGRFRNIVHRHAPWSRHSA